MSTKLFLEIFGGAGAVILGIGGCIWKCFRSYEFKFDYENEMLEPTDILDQEWETKGKDYPIEESFGESYNRLIFAKKDKGNWNVNIDKNHGNVYIYCKKDIPPTFNKGKHFLRINIKNINKNMKIRFEQKFFDNNYKYIGHRNISKPIRKNGENIFQPESIIDLHNNHPNAAKIEQLGVFISGTDRDIKNVIIDEVYYGEKWSFCHLFCCKKRCKTILYRKKEKE